MTISSVSSLLGIPVPTLRSWERRYGFPAPARTTGRHRRYTMDEVELLRALRDEITRGHPAREAILRGRASDGGCRGRDVDDVLDAAMRMDPERLRRTLDAATEALGMEAAIRDVALPSMHELGSRWKSGTCDVANEHLATEAVRAWLARLTTLSPPPFRAGAIVLACGPKDLHSVGLESFGVLLARRGWPVRILGPLTPAPSLTTAIRAAQARAAVITSQRNVTRRAAVEAITAASGIPGVAAFYAGNAFATPSARRDARGTYLGEDVVDAVDVLESTLAARASADALTAS
jgi:methanogenic corrinoid protein MtbC1